MKIPKLALVIGAVVLVVALGLSFHFYMKARIATAVALEHAKQAEAAKAQVETQLGDKQVVIDSKEAALDAARKSAIEREQWFQSQLTHVQTATPAQLVDQGSQILKAVDITTDGKVVTMGVETYRTAVSALLDWQEYKNVREPAWSAREALYKAEISDWKAKDILRDQKDALNESIIFSLKDVISHQKTMGFFEKAAWGAGGFVVGTVLGKLVK